MIAPIRLDMQQARVVPSARVLSRCLTHEAVRLSGVDSGVVGEDPLRTPAYLLPISLSCLAVGKRWGRPFG